MFKSAVLCVLFALVMISCNKKPAIKPVPLVSDSLKSVITVLAGSTKGYADGTGTAALFNHPTAAVFDLNGNLLVTDEFNNRIRKITPAGVVSTFAGNGAEADADGPALSASFFNPISMAVDRSGNLFVIDIGNTGGGYNIRKISVGGDVTTLPVIYNGVPLHHRMLSIITDTAGNIYVYDIDANDIKKIDVTGQASSITFPSFTLFSGIVSGFAFDSAGNLFISNDTRIFKVTTGGNISLFSSGYTKAVNGVNTQVNYISPSSLVIDKNDNVYVSDLQSIRMITKDGFAVTAVINCYAGGSSYNYLQINAIDASGNIFIPDATNHIIRKISFQH